MLLGLSLTAFHGDHVTVVLFFEDEDAFSVFLERQTVQPNF